MASLYTRSGSPYYWIKYRDAAGQICQVSTKCRVGIAPDVRRAREKEAEHSLRELQHDRRSVTTGWSWVLDFLKTRYQSKPTTFERYSCAWPTIQLFFDEQKLETPAQ